MKVTVLTIVLAASTLSAQSSSWYFVARDANSLYKLIGPFQTPELCRTAGTEFDPTDHRFMSPIHRLAFEKTHKNVSRKDDRLRDEKVAQAVATTKPNANGLISIPTLTSDARRAASGCVEVQK